MDLIGVVYGLCLVISEWTCVTLCVVVCIMVVVVEISYLWWCVCMVYYVVVVEY